MKQQKETKNDEYLNYIEFLERSLADFYDNLKKLAEYDRIKSVLEFMATHSAAHGERVNQLMEASQCPVLSGDLILDFQNRINREVREAVENEKDLRKVLKILADAEESLGMLYRDIAAFMDQLSDHYREVSSTVRELADEEENHRDVLLKNMEQLDRG